MKTKSILRSKTFWFNILTAIVYMAMQLSGKDVVDEKIIISVIAIGNALLRFVKKEPVKL